MVALLWGCGPEDSPEQAGAPQEVPASESAPGKELTPGTLEQELTSIGSYSWRAPALSTAMGSTSNRVCALTQVQGRLDTASDYARIYAVDSSWYLGGYSATAEMIAGARCADKPAGTSLSGEYNWTAGQSLPTNMGTTSGRACFLTRVNGGFNGSSDWVRIYASGGSWFIFGASQTAGTFARARCVTVPSVSSEYAWTYAMGQAEHMGSTSGRVCALTGIQGAFDGLGDYVQIYASAGSWYLRGATQPAGKYLVARARCF